VSTQLQYGKVGPGDVELINIDGPQGGTGQSILADGILNGCDCSTDTPNWLWNDAGNWAGRSSSGRRRDYKGKGLTGEADRFPRASRSRG
jgi:hypothetical protein